MHASSCSSSLEENTVDSHIITRAREHLARLNLYDSSAGRRCACLESDRCNEPSERFKFCICDFGRGKYHSDEGAPSGWPFRQ